MGQMAAGVAHEINNPLSAVLGMADLSREGLLRSKRPSDAELIENLDIVLEGARQCKH